MEKENVLLLQNLLWGPRIGREDVCKANMHIALFAPDPWVEYLR